jgi:hypothetical protein
MPVNPIEDGAGNTRKSKGYLLVSSYFFLMRGIATVAGTIRTPLMAPYSFKLKGDSK